MTGKGQSGGDIGFIGCGVLTEAVVRGIRARFSRPVIRLSPRSEAVSRRLAGEFPDVIREASNEDVVRRSQTVFLAIRPDQLEQALAGLTFREDQTVVSFVATAPVARIAALVAPAHRICRVTPLPGIARCKGPVILFPALPEIEALFQDLGDLIVARSEDEIRDLGSASGMMSQFFMLQQAMAVWLEARGVAPDAASLYVRSMLAMLGETALESPGVGFNALVDGHETPGGLNEHVRQSLAQAGVFDAYATALDSVTDIKL